MIKPVVFGAVYCVLFVTMLGAMYGMIWGGSLGHGVSGPGIDGAIFVGAVTLITFGIPAAVLGGIVGLLFGLVRTGRRSGNNDQQDS